MSAARHRPAVSVHRRRGERSVGGLEGSALQLNRVLCGEVPFDSTAQNLTP